MTDMKKYDVIIVGGGPAGLRCAEVLGESSLSVLLLEKEDGFGDKVCAGGITRKDLSVIDIPDSIIEHKITNTAVISAKRNSIASANEAFVFTLDRKELGQWQRKQINKDKVEVRTNTKVTEIQSDYLVVNDREKIGFKHLVGADGYKSIVRKYLKIPQEKHLIGIQYLIPDPIENPRLEIYLHSKYFKSWYAWAFPHKNSVTVGCACDPKMMSARKLKENFHAWLKEKGFNIENAHYESAPISYDYRGFKFGNIYLIGEAGGFASGLTGEGIYQSLVSGETAARTIMDEQYQSDTFQSVVRYNEIQYKIMKFLYRAGIFRGAVYELIVILLNNKKIKEKIHNSFS